MFAALAPHVFGRSGHGGCAACRLKFLAGFHVLLKTVPLSVFAHSHPTNYAEAGCLVLALGARHAVRRVGLELRPALKAAGGDRGLLRGGVDRALEPSRLPRRAGAKHLPREQVGELLGAEIPDFAVRVGLGAKSEVRVNRGDADDGGEDSEVGVGRDPNFLEPELVLAALVVVVDL